MITKTEQFLNYLMRRADSLERNAGLAGEMSDGGASKLRAQISVYKAGIANTVPIEWQSFYDSFEKLVTDDEYQQYLRLKSKFEQVN